MRLFLTLAIVMTAAGLVPASPQQKQDDAKQARARVDVQNLEKAVAAYKVKNGTFPPSLEDLTQGDKPFVEPKALLDPWGQRYHYDAGRLNKKGIPHLWTEGPKGAKVIIGNFEPVVPKQTTLYQRLGEEKGIAKIVDDLVEIVIADPKYRKELKDHFIKGDVKALKRKLIDQLGEATGGPQKYKGKNMKDAHKGMKITNDDFNALMDDVTKALVKNKVEAKDLRVIIKMLQKMRPDVVEVPAKSSRLERPTLERAPAAA